jgi:hypothetical protein
MSWPAGWQNPITVVAGQIQAGVDARLLLPARTDLLQERLDFQRGLLLAGKARLTPIQVTAEGVIWDGHHGVRAAAERGDPVDVLVVPGAIPPCGLLILQLPVR